MILKPPFDSCYVYRQIFQRKTDNLNNTLTKKCSNFSLKNLLLSRYSFRTKFEFNKAWSPKIENKFMLFQLFFILLKFHSAFKNTLKVTPFLFWSLADSVQLKKFHFLFSRYSNWARACSFKDIEATQSCYIFFLPKNRPQLKCGELLHKLERGFTGIRKKRQYPLGHRPYYSQNTSTNFRKYLRNIRKIIFKIKPLDFWCLM